jgi:hypothetical protein
MSQYYPPNDNSQQWNTPPQPPYQPQGPYGQPPTYYPQQPQPYYPQPPIYQQPGYPQQQPVYPQPQPKKKRKSIKEQWNSGPAGKFGVIATIVIALLVCGTCSGIMHAATSTGNPVATPTQTAAQVVPANTPVPTTKPAPTAKPKPTQSPAQIEADYKINTTDTDVASLDKDGNADMGNEEHFTCTLVAFVKDSSGTTAGANVTDPGSVSSSFVQIIFTPGTDITQLNTQDTVEVWGTNMGVSSGTNAFGGTVQEVVVQAKYMNDTTTGYKADF